MPLDPSDLLIGQISDDEIREFVHGDRSPRVDSFSRGIADLTLPLRIPGNKLKAAIQRILGVNYMDSANALRRSLPLFHSAHPWAWAESIQVVGMGQRGDDTAAVIWDDQITPSKWEYYDCLVTFGMPKYALWQDDEVSSEFERFVSKELTQDVQIVSVENGQVVYDAGSPFLWDLQPHAATIPVARREGGGLRLTWHSVPQEFVQAAPAGLEVDDGLPTKLLQVQGKVNDAEFLGQPAETFLCTGISWDKYVCPIVTDSIGGLYFNYDVHIELMYTKQLDSQIGKAGETRRGWNLLLGPKMLYWHASNVVSGKKIFEPVSFAKIFTHHSDTF